MGKVPIVTVLILAVKNILHNSFCITDEAVKNHILNCFYFIVLVSTCHLLFGQLENLNNEIIGLHQIITVLNQTQITTDRKLIIKPFSLQMDFFVSYIHTELL